jgi:formiminoglutamase
MDPITSSGWPCITDLVVDGPAEIALLGAPMGEGSVTPGRCDLAPAVIRRALRRFSTYDVETGQELSLGLHDSGDVALDGMAPAAGFEPIRDAVAHCTSAHALTLLLGGNNAVTRPAAHGLGLPLDQVGLITLDAHFDLRDTEEGPANGNPIRCLLEDGLPGRNICQIGLAPFANTAAMHHTAGEAGIGVFTIADVKRRGILAVLDEALARIAHTQAVMVDFDIDVIDRAQCPGAPGARPGGMPADMFFAAARNLAARPQVTLVDLTEFDPALDVADITALTAARWVCEILAGYAGRSPSPAIAPKERR